MKYVVKFIELELFFNGARRPYISRGFVLPSRRRNIVQPTASIHCAWSAESLQ